MWPDRVSNPGPLNYESGALPIALRGPALRRGFHFIYIAMLRNQWRQIFVTTATKYSYVVSSRRLYAKILSRTVANSID